MTRTLILSDTHFPDVSRVAYGKMLEFAKKLGKLDEIVLAGDWLDVGCLSRFSQPPASGGLLDEIKEGKDALADLRERWPKTEITWLHGNHCNRYDKFIVDHAPQLWEALSLEGLCEANRQGITIVKNWQKDVWHEADGILIGHPSSGLSQNAGQYALNHLKRKGQDLVVGHSHRLAMVSYRIGNKVVYGYENGCLCNLDPDYLDQPNWSWGFSWIENGEVSLVPLRP